MVFDWTLEEKTLRNIKKIIAVAWRMNGSQLSVYCAKLKKNRESILAGQIGSTFIDKMEWISGSGMEAGTKIWPFLMQDADNLLNMIQGHRNLDEKAWLRALQKLEMRQERYFKTELGFAFILQAKEKAGMRTASKKLAQGTEISVKTSRQAGRKDEKKDLELVAAWLFDDVQAQNKQAERKPRFFFARQLKRAAIPVLACLSACFMATWLYGQLVRNQSRWNLQQMKVSVTKNAEAHVEKNKEAASNTINYAKEAADAGKMVKKMSKQPQSRPQKLPQYKEMSKNYPQLYGWLQIPDTQIDLPVMRAESDKDFYLHHDFAGAQSAEGALFVDANSSIYPQDDNTVIYGHNMKNGHLFGMLHMYGDVDFFQAHREIQFDTLYETGTYEAVAVLKTRILNENEQGFRYYQFFQYDNEQEFQQCYDFVEHNRIFATDCTLQYGDKILMLSTCEYSQDNGRLVVVARRKEVPVDSDEMSAEESK